MNQRGAFPFHFVAALALLVGGCAPPAKSQRDKDHELMLTISKRYSEDREGFRLTDAEIIECRQAIQRRHPAATSCLSKMALQAKIDPAMHAEVQQLLPTVVNSENPSALLGAAMALRSGNFQDEKLLDAEISKRAEMIIASVPDSPEAETAQTILMYQSKLMVSPDENKQ